MIKSLRWRIQAWHALILLVVIAAFGGGLYLQASRARFNQLDAELLAGARVLEGVLRTMPSARLDRPHAMPSDRPPLPLPHGEPVPPDRREAPPRREDRPPGPPPWDAPPPVRPSASRRGPSDALSLPADFEDWYTREGEPPFFAIWLADGALLKSGGDGPMPQADPGVGPGLEYRFRLWGRDRIVTLMGPRQTRIVVGRPIGREMRELRAMGLRIGLAGLGLFTFGLIGGFWLSGRAVRPIATMSGTVASITAADLSARIDLAEVDNELGQLGVLLNVMLDRLEVAFAEQIRFTADASHELRTPLAVILAQADLALSRPRPAEEYRDALEACQRAARRMSGLVDDLLVLARMDDGRLDLEHAPVDLAALASESAAMLDPLARTRGVSIVVDEHAGPLWVGGDPQRLGQVLTNLLANAIRYNVPGGSVHIRATVDGHEAILTVADTGIGIEATDLPRVFDRFFRVDPARSRAQGSGGNGLGLAICKAVVEAHGGRIELTSRPGVGSTFVVRLPREDKARAADL